MVAMRTRTLARRVAFNSALMIFFVYLAMQSFVYFRDAFIFSTADVSDYLIVVGGFIAFRVIPPLAVFGFILWLLALRIQRVQERLEKGETLSPAETEKVRGRILQFKGIVLAINLIGFTVGFFLDLMLSGKFEELKLLHRDIILVSNLAGAFIFAAAQTALNNVAFAPLRDKLGITAIGNRKRETSSMVRQIRLSFGLILYASLVIQYNIWDVVSFQSWGAEVQNQVRTGALVQDQALATYRKLVADRMYLITDRTPKLADTIPEPWDPTVTRPQDQQQAVFLVMLLYGVLVVLLVQGSVSREQKDWLKSLQDRIQDVVAGGGDLRRRLSLRTMDDLGELAEMINRLLDQFQSIVGRIGAAAGQTREGARALETVLGRAEAVSAEVGVAVTSLRTELESQSRDAARLREALGAFREAAAAVDAEAANQGRFVSETSAAMEEMAVSIEGVRVQSREAGELTTGLSKQGEGGGQAVRETSQAIADIHRASQEVLQVLGSIRKIAADTNLLAMNAAIEAAHAGEKGAGFAVVADEVRKLATTASNQTNTIKDLIQAMARQVDSGVERARVSGTVLSDLVKGLEDSAQVSRRVADAMEEQAGRTRSVTESLTQVVGTSEAIREKMTKQGQTTDQMAGSLTEALDRLAVLVETSKRQAEAVAGLEASFAEVRREVDRNAAAAETLQAEVGRFQI
jgi:methyl-accepting chemotaxis protein